jgi:hypothetical protein
MKSIAARSIIVLAVGAMLTSVVIAAPALAKKHHHHHPKTSQTATGASGLSLVLLNSNDNQANWGEKVTFNVSTNATDYPFVGLNCYKSSTWVLSTSAGYFPSYPWPSTQDITLRSNAWTGGAADCTATLYSVDGGNETVLDTLSFHVYA